MSDATAVGDCVRVHVAWFTAKAELCGGWVEDDGEVSWAWVPPERTLYGLFPTDISAATGKSALRMARRLGARSVAVWSGEDVARPGLLDAGFELGWQPWWMTAPATDSDPVDPTQVRLTPTARPDDEGSGGLLSQPSTWRAEALAGGEYAGRAWLHVDGAVAGLFDMEVWPRFRRQGLGSELLALLVGVARQHGADRVVLNATPEGERLYRARGFERVGEGRTWWAHRSWWRR